MSETISKEEIKDQNKHESLGPSPSGCKIREKKREEYKEITRKREIKR